MSDDPLEIRAAELENAGDIARIRVETWKVAYTELVPQPVLDRMTVEADAERTAERFLDPSLRQHDDWLAWRGGEAIGWMSTGPSRDEDHDTERVGEVSALYVLPEAWGTGVALALMDFAIAEFRRLGFTSAVVWVMEGNGRAERFYERAGYPEDGSRRLFRSDEIPGHLRRRSRSI